jgi:hypothetical protein
LVTASVGQLVEAALRLGALTQFAGRNLAF